MQEAGVGTDESVQEIVWGMQYSCRGGSARRSRVEERREEMKVMFGKILKGMEESTGEDGDEKSLRFEEKV